MNLFGLSVSLAKNSNGKYVRKEECHQAQMVIKDRITSLEKHIDTRFEDLKTIILNK